MTNEELIKMARETCNPICIGRDFTAATVAAAILTEKGNVYTGVCVDLACGLGFCAEAAAIAEMLKNQEAHIVKVVAVQEAGEVVPPCGRCREMIAEVDPENMDCLVLVSEDEEMVLRDLLPHHWLTELREHECPNETKC